MGGRRRGVLMGHLQKGGKKSGEDEQTHNPLLKGTHSF